MCVFIYIHLVLRPKFAGRNSEFHFDNINLQLREAAVCTSCKLYDLILTTTQLFNLLQQFGKRGTTRY